MKIHDGSRLLIPLYHGTHEHFAKLIKRTGPGAANPHEELNTLELIERVIAVRPSILESPEWSGLDGLVLNSIRRQFISDGGFNFRHGGMYATTAKFKAMNYSRNRWGSELLTYAFRLFETLAGADPQAALQIEGEFESLMKLIRLPISPFLVKIDDVPLRCLRTELGGDPIEHLNTIQEFAEEYPGPDFLSSVQKCFEIVGPVPEVKLSFIRVEPQR